MWTSTKQRRAARKRRLAVAAVEQTLNPSRSKDERRVATADTRAALPTSQPKRTCARCGLTRKGCKALGAQHVCPGCLKALQKQADRSGVA